MKLLALSLGLLTTLAHAQNEARERPRPGGGPGHFLRAADRNGDGAVSFEEFSQLERISSLPEEKQKQLFARLDKDGDGMIRKDEIPKPPGGRGERGPFAMRQLDTNGDGVVDYDEFLAGPFAKRMPEDRRRAFFDRLDRNGDGHLSPEDQPRGGPRDGRRPPERPEPAEAFPRLDTNKDGSLDFEEFRKAPWIERLGEDVQEDRFEKLDRNGDLKLDLEEMKAARPDPARGRKPERPRQDGDRPGRRPKGTPEGDAPMMEEEGA